MQLLPILEADAVDEEMGVDVVAVNVGADQNLPALEPLRQLQRGGMSDSRIDILSCREGLHYVVELGSVDATHVGQHSQPV